jgi:hypothetical protein
LPSTVAVNPGDGVEPRQRKKSVHAQFLDTNWPAMGMRMLAWIVGITVAWEVLFAISEQVAWVFRVVTLPLILYVTGSESE